MLLLNKRLCLYIFSISKAVMCRRVAGMIMMMMVIIIIIETFISKLKNERLKKGCGRLLP